MVQSPHSPHRQAPATHSDLPPSTRAQQHAIIRIAVQKFYYSQRVITTRPPQYALRLSPRERAEWDRLAMRRECHAISKRSRYQVTTAFSLHQREHCDVPRY
uniref:Uncharacterized protein n=1 Tax=Knipowitschia caucasica TaxID=637954 RepID=A0AAV2L0X1_KNICA